jgi:hypothetical protein
LLVLVGGVKVNFVPTVFTAGSTLKLLRVGAINPDVPPGVVSGVTCFFLQELVMSVAVIRNNAIIHL